MLRLSVVVSWVIALGLAVSLSGCGSPTSQEKQKPTTSTEGKTPQKSAEQGEHAGQGHEDHAAQDQKTHAVPADASKGLAELADADRAAAEKQRVCPVSGDVLGVQGKPYKATVKGQPVFLCCPACEKQLLQEPDKYLAKLKAD